MLDPAPWALRPRQAPCRIHPAHIQPHCRLANRRIRLRMLRQRNQHAILPQNPGLLTGNLANRVAQILSVVDADIRDHTNHRLNRVRSIQPTAKPHFEHRQLHTLLRKPSKRDRRQQLEEARVMRQSALRNQAYCRGIDKPIDAPKVRVRNLPQPTRPLRSASRNLDALIHPHQVRRRIQSRLDPRSVGNRRQRGGRRTLAVRARNQHRGEALLRFAKRSEQRANVLQRKLSPHGSCRVHRRAPHAQLRPQRRQPFQCFVVRHHVYQSRTSPNSDSTDAATQILPALPRSINPSVRPAR